MQPSKQPAEQPVEQAEAFRGKVRNPTAAADHCFRITEERIEDTSSVVENNAADQKPN